MPFVEAPSPGPAGPPVERVDGLDVALLAADHPVQRLQQQDIAGSSGVDHDKLVEIGVQTGAMTPQAFAEFQRQEMDKWGRAVKDSGVTLD